MSCHVAAELKQLAAEPASVGAQCAAKRQAAGNASAEAADAAEALRAEPASTSNEPQRSSKWSWGRIVTVAGLVVLGVTPWAHGQLPPPNDPAFCPPLTAFAGPTAFDLFWGTTPIRFPYQ